MKNYYFILGNGFSIDLINHIEKQTNKKLEIDLSNLFAFGNTVQYPAFNKEPGFLSKKYTPNLWGLGARSILEGTDSMEIIENLMTCANVSLKSESGNLEDNYKSAYQELSLYLKYLFIHYNSLTTDDLLIEHTEEWSWLKFIKKIFLNKDILNIYIITYNYDIWLERLLKLNDIPFSIGGIESYNDEKIIIYKPHGSISFAYQKEIEDPNSFKIINKERDLVVGKACDYNIVYENLDNKIYPQNAMIPPAGDSESIDRLKNTWAADIRTKINQALDCSKKHDTLIISGISYWHVDRNEIDNILIRLPEDANIKNINPFPSRTLETVLSGLFKNSIHYSNSKILEKIENEG